MEKYLLKKDWFSKRHGKTIGKGAYVIIKIKEELEELLESFKKDPEKVLEKVENISASEEKKTPKPKLAVNLSLLFPHKN